MNGAAIPIQKRRLLRATLAHYRQPDVSEEDFHRWVTEEYAPQAARLHAKNEIEGFSIYFSPKSFQSVALDLNTKRGNPWVVRDYDAQVEFLFRDMETFLRGAADPEMQLLHAAEQAFISSIHPEISFGWIETYVDDGKVVNIGEDGKSSYPDFQKMNAAP